MGGQGGKPPAVYRPDGGVPVISRRGEEMVALIFVGFALWLATHTWFAAAPALVGIGVGVTVMRRHGGTVLGVVALLLGAAAVVIGIRHGIVQLTRTPSLQETD